MTSLVHLRHQDARDLGRLSARLDRSAFDLEGCAADLVHAVTVLSAVLLQDLPASAADDLDELRLRLGAAHRAALASAETARAPAYPSPVTNLVDERVRRAGRGR